MESLSATITGLSKPFVLLLAADATKLSDEQILHAAEQIVPMGLCYLCAWGPGCKRMHDLFDRVAIPFEATTQNPFQKVIMTTWHDDESLRKATWFFQNCAWPPESNGPDDVAWLAVSINNRLWSNKITDTLVANRRRR